MNTNEKLERLMSDAMSAYQSGAIAPTRHEFFTRVENACAGCLLGAAYVHLETGVVPKGEALVLWAMAKYRLSRAAIDGLVCGFDSGFRTGEPGHEKFFLNGFAVGSAAAEQLFEGAR